MKSSSRKKGRRTMSKALERKLAKAQHYYLNEEYPKAIELLLEVIREKPNIKVPYVTLSMIHEEMGDPTRGLSYLLIAAQVQDKDPDLWVEVAQKSEQMNNFRQVGCRVAGKSPALT